MHNQQSFEISWPSIMKSKWISLSLDVLSVSTWQCKRVLINGHTVTMMNGTVGALKLWLSYLSLWLYQKTWEKSFQQLFVPVLMAALVSACSYRQSKLKHQLLHIRCWCRDRRHGMRMGERGIDKNKTKSKRGERFLDFSSSLSHGVKKDNANEKVACWMMIEA